MSPRQPNDMRSRERRVQLRNLQKAAECLRANLHLHGVDLEAGPHMERALAHVQEAEVAIQKRSRARSVSELITDCEIGENLIQKIQQHGAERDRGSNITP